MAPVIIWFTLIGVYLIRLMTDWFHLNMEMVQFQFNSYSRTRYYSHCLNFSGKRSPRRRNSNFKKTLPNARKIRVAAFPTGQVNNTLWTNSAMLWGQFLAHDMSLLRQPDFGTVKIILQLAPSRLMFY